MRPLQDSGKVGTGHDYDKTHDETSLLVTLADCCQAGTVLAGTRENKRKQAHSSSQFCEGAEGMDAELHARAGAPASLASAESIVNCSVLADTATTAAHPSSSYTRPAVPVKDS